MGCFRKFVFTLSSAGLLAISSCGGGQGGPAEGPGEEGTVATDSTEDGGPALDGLVASAVDYAIHQLRSSVSEIDDRGRHARYTGPDGRWRTVGPGDWTAGFWSGCLWLAYDLSGDTAFRDWAAEWTAGLESQATRTDTHDLGFLILNSFGNGYRLTGEAAYREVCVTAAGALASRFDPDVGAIKSWDWGEWAERWPVIVDNMMNLELLFFGAAEGGDGTWGVMAVSHADTTARDHVRPDHSTIHLVDYNPDSGEVLSRETYSGISDDSTWSCGHAWAVYGFTMTLRMTGETRFLETAMRLADWYLDNLPDDGVPYWDFDAPEDDDVNNDHRDVAAGAIALSGILDLVALLEDAPESARYRSAARSILESLCTTYLSKGQNTRGILLHGYGDNPANETDVSLIYADYYFLQALLRYRALRER